MTIITLGAWALYYTLGTSGKNCKVTQKFWNVA